MAATATATATTTTPTIIIIIIIITTTTTVPHGVREPRCREQRGDRLCGEGGTEATGE